jgi:hypothetical protein
MVLNPTRVAVPENVSGHGWGGNVSITIVVKVPPAGAVKATEKLAVPGVAQISVTDIE